MIGKPLIGISVSARYQKEDPVAVGALTLGANYVEGVIAAGGLPILMAPRTDFAELVELVDGWLIPGGDDIDPSLYGQEIHPKASLIDPERFAFERSLFEAVPAELPIFGICYGCQFLNVMRGGTLHQHVPDVVGHDEHAGGTLAGYAVAAGTRSASLLGAEAVEGKSYHHQAVDRVGRALAVTARHPDGTIEGLEATDRPWVVTVQWHPERMLESEGTRRLFEAFVAAAAEYRSRR